MLLVFDHRSLITRSRSPSPIIFPSASINLQTLSFCSVHVLYQASSEAADAGEELKRQLAEQVEELERRASQLSQAVASKATLEVEHHELRAQHAQLGDTHNQLGADFRALESQRSELASAHETLKLGISLRLAITRSILYVIASVHCTVVQYPIAVGRFYELYLQFCIFRNESRAFESIETRMT